MKEWPYNTYRRFPITTVNVETAETFIVNEGVGAVNIPEYIVASSAVPGIFPTSVINGSMFIDGGTNDNLNIKGGIERCREIVGDNDEDIIIDVLMTNALKKSTWMDMSEAKTYTAYSRGNEISSEGQSYWYVHDVLKAYPNVNWRYFVVPKEALPNYPVIALSFDRETLKKTEQIGYELTKELIMNNESFHDVFRRAEAAIPKRIRLD